MPDPEVKAEIKTEIKTEPAPPPETKVEGTPEAKVEAKPEVKTEVKTEAPAPAPAPPPPPEKKPDWRDSRIAELTAKLNQEKARRIEPPLAPGESEAAFNARVEARAKELAEPLAAQQAAVADFNRQCNDVATAGKAAHPDFMDKFGQLKSVVNGADVSEVQAYNSVLAAAIETGAAPELLYDLSSDPGEFRKLMSLPPLKLGVELATRAAKLAPKVEEPSQLPKPITALGSRGEHYEGITPDDPNRGTKLPLKEWMARREKQVQERGLQ